MAQTTIDFSKFIGKELNSSINELETLGLKWNPTEDYRLCGKLFSMLRDKDGRMYQIVSAPNNRKMKFEIEMFEEVYY